MNESSTVKILKQLALVLESKKRAPAPYMHEGCDERGQCDECESVGYNAGLEEAIEYICVLLMDLNGDWKKVNDWAYGLVNGIKK